MFSRNTLKAFAFLLMAIDHIGLILFPKLPVLRIVGRLSFPIFAYLLADGVSRTKNVRKMLRRLLFFAVVSQIPYSMAVYGYFTLSRLNIFFTLFMGAMACVPFQNAGQILTFIIIALLPNDYGCYGALLIVGFFVLIRSDWFLRQKAAIQKLQIFVLLLTLTVPYVIITGEGLQIFAIFAALLPPCSFKQGQPWGKWAYTIYPLHFLVLWAFTGFRTIAPCAHLAGLLTQMRH